MRGKNLSLSIALMNIELRTTCTLGDCGCGNASQQGIVLELLAGTSLGMFKASVVQKGAAGTAVGSIGPAEEASERTLQGDSCHQVVTGV